GGARAAGPGRARSWGRRTSSLVLVLACLLGWSAAVRDHDHRSWVWALAATGLVAGIPHGALDHLAAARLLHRRRSGTSPLRALLAAGTLYAALAATTYLVFVAAPAPSLLLFLVLSVLHFGAGEVTFWDLPRRGRRVVAPVAGGLVLLVPLARDPQLTGASLDALGVRDPLSPAWSTGVLLALPTAAVLVAGALLLTGRTRPAAELAALVVLVSTTPPLLALAAYFGGWHAVRHTALLLEEDPVLRVVLRERGTAAAVRRFAVLAALPTGVVLLGLALLWSGSAGAVTALAATLPVLAAVTVPHGVVVALSARRTSGRSPAPGCAPVSPAAGGGRRVRGARSRRAAAPAPR
ncbi:Brp/Blh family beta-carotene 15,15'-dioxygenase, partial [Klenkia sp. PcliD-1-E]|uniref:Brp/Blh family beta-carotene 15,15'-dioxygenase n=1 Tax=Klenkia sp. PcliD-1-E TaxID=2954492 RepID=UPI0020977985